MIRKDDTVNLRGLSSDAWWAAFIADQVHQEITGEELVITSAADGRHQVDRSAHYRGDAIDLRIWKFPTAEGQRNFCRRLEAELGADYVVLLERDHVHIHWSPKR